MSAQDITLQQYHQWMTINATSHLIRAGRQIGIFDQLREGQRTHQQLCDVGSLESQPTKLLLDALVAIGIVEQYQDDYALSRAGHLLCQYDQDLGDQRWEGISGAAQGTTSRTENDDQQYFDRTAATQWIHTPAAMQAAEILDIGGEDQPSGISILDLGCGSAVWSCAMAHRDPHAQVTAVDHPGAIEAAQTTADSIELGERFETIASLPSEADLTDEAFDLVLLAQRLGGLSGEAANRMLQKAARSCRSGGRVAVIDSFRLPSRDRDGQPAEPKPNLVEAIEALTIELDTCGGQIRTLDQTRELLKNADLAGIQFTFLAASQANFGMAVAVKP